MIVVLTCLFESFPFLVAALYIVVHDSKICALVSIGVTVAWITLHKSRRVLFGSLFSSNYFARLLSASLCHVIFRTRQGIAKDKEL